jgi:hypothetical protein
MQTDRRFPEVRCQIMTELESRNVRVIVMLNGTVTGNVRQLHGQDIRDYFRHINIAPWHVCFIFDYVTFARLAL